MRSVCVWAVTLSSKEPTSLRSCLARREGDGSRAAPRVHCFTFALVVVSCADDPLGGSAAGVDHDLSCRL